MRLPLLLLLALLPALSSAQQRATGTVYHDLTTLPPKLPPGTHRLWVQSEDMYGRTYDASTILRVQP